MSNSTLDKTVTTVCGDSFNIVVLKQYVTSVTIDWDLVPDAEVYKIEKFQRRKGWQLVGW